MVTPKVGPVDQAMAAKEAAEKFARRVRRARRFVGRFVGWVLGEGITIAKLNRSWVPGLVNVYIRNWKITMFNGNIHYKWTCSIATLNY